MRNKQALSESSFLSRVREYLPGNAAAYELDPEGSSRELTHTLHEGRFYLFNAETVLALSHAIEDIALDEGCGAFIANVLSTDHFESQHERFWQLAATLDDVTVIAPAKLPRRNRRLKFCHDREALLKKFWSVIYDGPRCKAILLCEQSNLAEQFEERQFAGFFSFNPATVKQSHRDVASLLAGECPELEEFRRLRRLDAATKRLHVEFAKEKEKLELAIQKLHDGSSKYHPEHFIADFDKTLQRLTELKGRLPELISGHRR